MVYVPILSLKVQALAEGGDEAKVLAEKAALEKAQLQLGYTDIRAPIGGRTVVPPPEYDAKTAAPTDPASLVEVGQVDDDMIAERDVLVDRHARGALGVFHDLYLVVM